MAVEIAEIPAVAARLLESGEPDALAKALRGRTFPFAVICGRGSSGHAGVYLRYLIETRLGLVVSAAAPSVITNYERTQAMRGALFIVISQSGRSPDLIAATEAAAKAGALTVALVNDTASPVAKAAAMVLSLLAGPEQSVAATKTVAASMIAAAQLVARLAADRDLLAAAARWPDRLRAALALDWSAWGAALAAGRAGPRIVLASAAIGRRTRGHYC